MITEPGEYELYLQMRLVQIGKDKSGQIYYPITWLPEVTTKIQINFPYEKDKQRHM